MYCERCNAGMVECARINAESVEKRLREDFEIADILFYPERSVQGNVQAFREFANSLWVGEGAESVKPLTERGSLNALLDVSEADPGLKRRIRHNYGVLCRLQPQIPASASA